MLRAIFVTLCLILIQATQTAQAERRIALVIGNGAYQHTSPLANPTNDARLMADTLRGIGFEVTLKLDLTEDQMEDAFNQHGQRLTSAGADSIGILYYAGHGIQSQGRNYLIPVDARMQTEQDVWGEAPYLGLAIRHIIAADNRMNFIILDACRNNPLPSTFRGAEDGLAEHVKTDGLLIAYATEPSMKAFDGAGNNSPFTRALAEVLPVEGLIAEQMFKRVADRVKTATNGAQRPFYNSGLTGDDFYFSGRGGGSILGADAAAMTAFNAADTACEYQSFIDRFPGSPLASAARRLAAGCGATSASGAGRGTGETSADEARLAALSAAGIVAGSDTYQPGDTFRDTLSGGGSGPEMTIIPSGSFMMGSPANERGRDDDEGPQRRVEIDYKFAVGTYEVSWAEWEACANLGGCDGSGPQGEGGDESWGKGTRPVINVSWDDARDYAQWLSVKTGETYRLLSEAEWEYAARAGTTSAFWWGANASHEYANYGKDECCGGLSSGRDRWRNTAPAGSFPANAFGLHDMHGNVHERVEDWSMVDHSRGPSDGSPLTNCSSCRGRVVRGGAWLVTPEDLRSASRFGLSPGFRGGNLGFRLARVITE